VRGAFTIFWLPLSVYSDSYKVALLAESSSINILKIETGAASARLQIFWSKSLDEFGVGMQSLGPPVSRIY